MALDDQDSRGLDLEYFRGLLNQSMNLRVLIRTHSDRVAEQEGEDQLPCDPRHKVKRCHDEQHGDQGYRIDECHTDDDERQDDGRRVDKSEVETFIRDANCFQVDRLPFL